MPGVPGVLNYPTSLDDVISLIEAKNNAVSTLDANVSASDLLIPVTDPTKFSASGIATLVDDLSAPTRIEIFHFTSKSGSNLVVPEGFRGAQDTTAQAWNTGNFVVQKPTARHHTTLADLLLLLEAKLGIGASAPGGAGQALCSDAAGASVWRALTMADVAGLSAALADKVSRTDPTPQTLGANLALMKTAPAFTLIDTTPDPDDSAVIDLTGGTLRLTPNLLIDLATGAATFAAIPILPASNPTIADQAARKQYVDDTQTAWSMSFFEDDPTVPALQSENRPVAFIPDGFAIVVNKLRIMYKAGSHTPGGALTYALIRHGPSGDADLGHIALDDANNTLGVNYSVSITPATLQGGDVLIARVESRSGTVSERAVSVGVIGTQKRIAS